MTVTALPDGRVSKTAKRIAPSYAKRGAKAVIRTYGWATSAARRGPDYVIVGAKRCGTTSLHNYLLGHPDVAALFPRAGHIKGIHYFDRHPRRPVSWYRSHFPLRPRHGVVCGEASPYYLIHPLAAERAAAVAPRAKIIILLRDPAERAYSHYRDEVKLGNEPLSFAAAVAAEQDRLAPELARMDADPHYYSFVHEHLSYVSWGRYAEHLDRWRRYYPDEQILVLRSEDLFIRPGPTVRRVTDFLGLRPHASSGYPQYNATGHSRAEQSVVDDLRAYYRPLNLQLARIVPDLVLWDRTRDSA